MSTLVHVPDDRFGPSERDTIQPPRFFSLRSHERARRMLGRVGRVERFETWPRAASTDWQYQWAVVRISHAERSARGEVTVDTRRVSLS